MWGLLRSLGKRRLRPQHRGMADAWTRQPRCIPGDNLEKMARRQPAKWRHCIGNFWAGWSQCRKDPEFQPRQCGEKEPLVGRWRQSFPLRPRALFPVCWCVPQVTTFWPISWVSFWPTQHSWSHRHYLQNWPPTWYHYQDRREDWGTRFDYPLVVRDLSLFCCYLQPTVWNFRGWQSRWALGTSGRCRSEPVRQATWFKLSRLWGCSSYNMCQIYQTNTEVELQGIGYNVQEITLSSPGT